MLHTFLGLSLAAVAAALAVPGVAHAAPPPNDHYLQSFAIPTTATGRLTREQVRHQVDTSEATTQGDLFSPPAAGGGLEPTTCAGISYGRTVWYDARSTVAGVAEVRVSGFDAVIAVHEYDRASSRLLRTVACFAADRGPSESGIFAIEPRRSYTMQVGGAHLGGGPAGGLMDFSFEYFSDTDRDGVIDGVDRCERIPGRDSRDGCPPRLELTPKIRAVPTSRGIRVLSLSARATRGARVEVTCRRGCRGRERRRAGGRAVRFSRFNGRSLPAGAVLEMRATRPGSIGAYTRYRVQRGDFSRADRCMLPGSRTPRTRCT